MAALLQLLHKRVWDPLLLLFFPAVKPLLVVAALTGPKKMRLLFVHFADLSTHPVILLKINSQEEQVNL